MNDFLLALGAWLRTTPLLDISLWLSNSWLCTWLQAHFLAIPVLQSIHLIGIAALFGSALMINFKVLGLTGETRSLGQVIDRYQPWMWGGLILALVTGVLLVISEPIRNLLSPAFSLKMIALLAAALVSLWFQSSVRARAANGAMALEGTAALRGTAVLIILLWCVVITGGRWIAYV